LWYAINRFGREGLKARALASLELAQYLTEKLKEIGVDAWRNENAITVVFPQISDELCTKWQLASDSGRTHIICMPGVTKEKIDEFLKDLKNA
jgi:histidine decarboxylase